MRRSMVGLVVLGLGVALMTLPVQVASAQPGNPTIVLPASEATLAGTQYLDTVATSGATEVQYELSGGSLNNQVIATATPTWVGWAAVWNTTTVANGSYTLTSVASYPGGVSEPSEPITLTVDNAPPSTTVVYPANGATLSADQTQLYDAVASAGVTGVQIDVSGAGETSTLDATPTIYGWIASNPPETCVPPPGGGCADIPFSYTVQSVATYASGLTGTSSTVSITINVDVPIGV
jgi:hypothetical protein